MVLTINLKDGSFVQLSNFEEVSFSTGNGKIKVDADNFEDFRLYDGVTYNFKGEQLVSVNGKEIKYLELY